MSAENSENPNKKNLWAWVVVGFIFFLFILSIYDEIGNNRTDPFEGSQTVNE